MDRERLPRVSRIPSERFLCGCAQVPVDVVDTGIGGRIAAGPMAERLYWLYQFNQVLDMLADDTTA